MKHNQRDRQQMMGERKDEGKKKKEKENPLVHKHPNAGIE